MEPEAYGGFEDVLGVNASIFGSRRFKSLVEIGSQFGGVLVLVNPNGDEHFVYPSYAAGYQLSAGNRTDMIGGLPGTIIIAAPIAHGPVGTARRRLPGISSFGVPGRTNQSVAVGGQGGRGGVMLQTAAGTDTARILYFADTHQFYLGTVAQYKAGTGGTALGAAPVAGPFTKAEERTADRSAFVGRVPGVLGIYGDPTHSSALAFQLGGIDDAFVLWVDAAGVLQANSPTVWYSS